MAVDYFLKIDGIEGESADSKHKGEIDLMSFSWGAHQTGTMSMGGGGGAGKVNVSDFNFTMTYNKASPKLFMACAQGDHIKKAQLFCRKAGGKQEEYLTITFSDLLVSAYQTGGAQGQDIPVESISINFAKVELEYKQQDAKGSVANPVKVGYNIKTNTKV